MAKQAKAPPTADELQQRQERRRRDAFIRESARNYEPLPALAKALMSEVGDELLSGNEGTIYLKRTGHRALSKEDIANVISQAGLPVARQALADFEKAQQQLSARLRETTNIGLISEQTEISTRRLYYRMNHPEQWKAEQMVTVMAVVERLKL